MNTHVKVPAHFHNKFELSLIDSRTGRVKQRAKAENVVLDRFWTIIGGTANVRPFVRVALGTGTGTPASSDEGLFTFAFSVAVDATVIETVKAYPTSHVTKTATFPATASYVGTLTEVGLSTSTASNTGVVTHAMLTDAEGNIITIEKTDLDILIVTATLYCTISSSGNSFYLPTYETNKLLTWLFSAGSSSLCSPLYPGPSWEDSCTFLELLAACVPVSNSIFNTYTAGVRLGNDSGSAWDGAARTLTIIGTRLTTDQGNTRYYHGLRLSGNGHIQFPNADVFPSYEIAGISLGVGDGATTAFRVPIPLFVANTDKVYKNGTLLTRGVDYTIENNSNPDMLCNISPGNFAVYDPYTGAELASGTSFDGFTPLVCDADPITIDAGSRPTAFCMSPSCPAVFTLVYTDALIGARCNYFRVGSLLGCFSSYASYSISPAGMVLTLEYSNDKVSWTTAGILTVTTTDPQAEFGVITFDPVEATYWRLSMDISNLAEPDYSWYNGYCTRLATANAMSLGYTNPTGLVFAVAPSNGDVLTMDCTIDRPYKNENFVIDAALTVQV